MTFKPFLVGDYTRGHERLQYQSYQNTPVESFSNYKKTTVPKSRSSKHILSKENLISRHEGLPSRSNQYFGYANQKSEDELSSVSVGKKVDIIYCIKKIHYN